MKFFVTSDADEETGLHELVYEINRQPMDDFFKDRLYDDSGIGLCIVLMGRDPIWNFKRRIRFMKKRNTLYIDVMCNWYAMVSSDRTTRKRIVGEKIVNEVPQIIAKKKFEDFDLPRFSSDLRKWFEQNGWIPEDFSAEETDFEYKAV